MSRKGRYTIVRKLAEGGMAEIFLAKQRGSEGFEKLVVLKRIHGAFSVDPQFRDMLVDEAHISMGLSHNNIAHVLDLGRAEGRYYLVLELVDGWDLSRVIERGQALGRPLPLGLAVYVMAEVCRALSYAHGKRNIDGHPLGIVHRDVSPQNILLSEQGEVKLTDFGIAKARTKRDRTSAGVVKGKVGFMSPEQALGQPVDARSDLFSVGTVLYLLAVGKLPFDAPTELEVLLRVQAGQGTPPEAVDPNLSPALGVVIRRALTADREQRYQTADELLVDLEEILRGEFHSAGSTELKLWLADLCAADGILPIGRAITSATSRPGSAELVAGEDIELGEEADEPPRHARAVAVTAMHGVVTADSDPGEFGHEGDVSPGVAERSLDEALEGNFAGVSDRIPDGLSSEIFGRPRRRHGGRIGGVMALVLVGSAVGVLWHSDPTPTSSAAKAVQPAVAQTSNQAATPIPHPADPGLDPNPGAPDGAVPQPRALAAVRPPVMHHSGVAMHVPGRPPSLAAPAAPQASDPVAPPTLLPEVTTPPPLSEPSAPVTPSTSPASTPAAGTSPPAVPAPPEDPPAPGASDQVVPTPPAPTAPPSTTP